MKTSALAVLTSASLLTGLTAFAYSADRISLAGMWRFQLDHANAGIKERWFERTLPQKIRLPGSLPAQGVGDDITVETKWTGRHCG